MHSIGCHGAVIEWFVSYLSNRHQRVSAHGSLSDDYICNRGVPQGSVLGPLLFCLHIRSVPSVFLSGVTSMSQLYADDITFYTSSESIDKLCDTLSSDLANLNKYLCERSLLLNPLKTQFLVISKPSQSIPCATSIHLNTTVIPAVYEAKYLGVIIDSHLTFKGQVESVCRSIEKQLGAYRRGRKYLSHTARRMSYISVIQTSLTYASVAYVHSLTQHLYDRLIIKSHLAMKTVFRLHRRTPTAFVLSHAKLSPIELRYNFKYLSSRKEASSRSTVKTSKNDPKSLTIQSNNHLQERRGDVASRPTVTSNH